MSLPPNDSTATTRPCRYWRRVKPTSDDAGFMCATIGHSAARPGPPAAMFYYSRDRGGEHPVRHLAGYAGILQADAYGGYNKLYEAERKPGPITEAPCWVQPVGPSSSWPMSKPMPGARRKEDRQA